VDDLKKKRFLWGIVLAWVPWIPVIISAFRGISEQKATGLGAVAGGISESLIVWGLITMVICQVAAIVWLSRSFSPEHAMRSLISGFSICLSTVMLALMGWVTWLLIRH
jgi:hypothetical protein